MMLDAVACAVPGRCACMRCPTPLPRCSSIFNDVIWPDFSRIPSQTRPFVRYLPLQVGQGLQVTGIDIEVLPRAIPWVTQCGVIQGGGCSAVTPAATARNSGNV
jgi:hypothetical protein